MSMSRLLINFSGHHNFHQYNRCLIIGRSLSTNATDNKASLEQLITLEGKLAAELPKFFTKPHNFSLYTRNVVFIDNTRNIKTEGINLYFLQLQLIKMYHNVRYSSLKVELLNLVKNPEESYLRIRWRIITRPGLLKTALLIFKAKVGEEWRDGISTMHVDKDGKIYCHVCDNIDVDTDDRSAKEKSSVKNPLVNRGLSVCNKPRV